MTASQELVCPLCSGRMRLQGDVQPPSLDGCWMGEAAWAHCAGSLGCQEGNHFAFLLLCFHPTFPLQECEAERDIKFCGIQMRTERTF